MELDADASLEEAAQAYRDLVAVWHPDRYGHNRRLQQKAQRRLQEINAAYEQVRRCIEEGSQRFGSGEGPAGRGRRAGKTPPWGRDFCSPRPRRRWPRVLLIVLAVSVAASLVAMNSPAGREIRGKIAAAWEGLSAVIQLGNRLGENPAGKGQPVDIQKGPAQPNQASSPPTPPPPAPLYEIHLKSGTVIGTSFYEEEGEMVYFRTAGGSMGVARERIREIRRITSP